jgi:hypothetical protein
MLDAVRQQWCQILAIGLEDSALFVSEMEALTWGVTQALAPGDTVIYSIPLLTHLARFRLFAQLHTIAVPRLADGQVDAAAWAAAFAQHPTAYAYVTIDQGAPCDLPAALAAGIPEDHIFVHAGGGLMGLAPPGLPAKPLACLLTLRDPDDLQDVLGWMVVTAGLGAVLERLRGSIALPRVLLKHMDAVVGGLLASPVWREQARQQVAATARRLTLDVAPLQGVHVWEGDQALTRLASCDVGQSHLVAERLVQRGWSFRIAQAGHLQDVVIVDLGSNLVQSAEIPA